MKMRGKFTYKPITISTEELLKAARTLIGKPIRLNFDETKTVGKVVETEVVNETLDFIVEVDITFVLHVNQVVPMKGVIFEDALLKEYMEE